MPEIELKRRTIPERLAYLAAKLRDGERDPETTAVAVALALDMLSGELAAAEQPSEPRETSSGDTVDRKAGRAAMQAIAEALPLPWIPEVTFRTLTGKEVLTNVFPESRVTAVDQSVTVTIDLGSTELGTR